MDINIDQIKALVELMVEHDLSRVELQEGDGHLLLRRGHAPVYSALSAPAPAPAAPQAAQSAAAPAPAPAGPPAAAPASNETVIKSPMVGTFYSSPDPDSPAFVKVGDVISPDTVVCLVEAMKVFNEIKAEVSGRVTRVMVANAQAVEFDQPLFSVVPA